MSAVENLHDVLVDQLKDLLNAEKQLVKALPKMARAASSEELRSALEEHLEVTRAQADRLQKVFATLGLPVKSKKCAAMAGLIEEGEEILETKKESVAAALDAAIICAAQKVEHYEISSYGSARTFAEVLGYQEAAHLLQETLDEESDANESLTKLAEEINAAAAEGADEESEDDEELVGSSAGAGSRGGSRSRKNGSRGRKGSRS